MSIRAILLLLTLLLVPLPIGVAAIAWRGLDRMDASVAGIAEEYSEVEALVDITSRLDVAVG
jgi:hydrogenase maturation factor